MEEQMQGGVEWEKEVDLQEDIKGTKEDLQEIMVDMQEAKENVHEKE